ncbi:MAG: hypothetical protein AUI83_14540 [Armatimonadetes bacterium 13_1_40CM_3_65_7]|uniref:SLH domain-containing protein n=1 Tax=Candidatus Segetimicrobium genomatis TaxID=2569760 RepID=A0A537J0A7_9BACT|nr:MAG: hypothetical protein AUI83_14540 [Armatimonadetes bacterium 13_1_40CM_3_65_7]TMI76988.1 MAG: hypothetical protein E6H05_01900 [Terrabacteria group bacterium ANGP1]
MRWCAITLAIVALAAWTAWAQGPSAFVDVPPWHWAFEAVQQGATAGVFTGYPTDDNELVANALVQVYEAFAHAGHPGAQGWAEWFLTNTPTQWPQPLHRSRLLKFALEDIRVRVSGDRARATFVAAVTVGTDGGQSALRSPIQAQAAKDGSGHWRIDYTALAAGQPQIFR